MSYYELGLKMLQTKKSFSMKVCLLANKLNEIFYTRDLTGINGVRLLLDKNTCQPV